MSSMARQQASVMSFADVFLVLTVLFIALAALGVIMKKPGLPKARQDRRALAAPSSRLRQVVTSEWDLRRKPIPTKALCCHPRQFWMRHFMPQTAR